MRTQILADGTQAYWINTELDAIRRIDLVDLEATPQTVASTKFTSSFALDNANLYWLDYDDLGGRVMSVPRAGGSSVTLCAFSVTGVSDRTAIAVDETDVYWTTYASVMRVHKDGTSVDTLAQQNTGVTNLALSSSNVYWASDASTDTELTTAIRTVTK